MSTVGSGEVELLNINREDGDENENDLEIGDGEGDEPEQQSEDFMTNCLLAWRAIRKAHLLEACSIVYRNPMFWALVTLLIMSEPILTSWDPEEDSRIIDAAIAIMAFSTLFFFIQVAAKVYSNNDQALQAQALAKSKGKSGTKKSVTVDEDSSLWQKLLLSTVEVVFTGSFILEFFTLLIGWIFIFYKPGIANLRCFRAFRILWYHELPPDILNGLKKWLAQLLWILGGRDLVDLLFKVMKFATTTLTHLGQEMFFSSQKARGGFILMAMLFYMAYVLGSTLWIETRNSNLGDYCVDLGTCTFTMIRLTFFDGDGFDYLYSLIADHPLLFIIVCIYICVTAFGIVNGLIGVFGDIFKDDSDEVFETQKEFELKQQKIENDNFQRYNNTAESLVMIQMQLSALESQNAILVEAIQNMQGISEQDKKNLADTIKSSKKQ